MENILLLIAFLIFRAVFSELFASQKTQRSPRPKTPLKPKRIPMSPVQDTMPTIIPIEEVETAKTQLEIVNISREPIEETIEEEPLQEKIIQTHFVESDQAELLAQSETFDGISQLFTQENILRGIILQEILSPPKALVQPWRRW